MANIKVTEEQIVAVLRDPQYTSERQRAIALWRIPSGSHIKKFKEIRKKYGIPEPEPGKRGKAVSINNTSEPALLKFEDIRKDDRLMKGKKRLIVLATSDEEILLRHMDGSSFSLSRKVFGRTAADYTKVPPGDPQGGPVKSYIDPSLKAGDIKVNGQPIKNLPDSVKEKIVDKLKEESEPKKPGMTINPEFEAAVQEMEAEHKTRKAKEVKPCIHFLQNCRYCSLIDCKDCPDFKDGIAVAEALEVAKPFVTVPVEPFSSSPDYIDSEWGVVEKEITDTVLGRRDYLDQVDQLLDLLVSDCAEPEMAELVKKVICYKLVIGFEKEIGQEAGA